MDRYQCLEIQEEKRYKRQIRARNICYYIIVTGIASVLLFVGGFFLIQHLIHSRIRSYTKSNGTEFAALDALPCQEELNVSDLGQDFSSLSFYQMGWDNDGLPVWVLELGKFDIRGIVSKDEENVVKIDRLGTQVCAQIVCSMKQAVGKLSQKEAWVVIINMEGYSFYQFTSYAAVDVMLKFISKVMPLVEHTDYGYFLNLNYVSYGLLKLVRPILGEAINRLIIESDPQNWMPALKSKIPIRYLSETFGGYSNYTCDTQFCTFYRPHL